MADKKKTALQEAEKVAESGSQNDTYFYAAVIAATAVAGYAIYRLLKKSSGKLGQEEFYDRTEDYKWYSLINRSADYTGLGVYPTEKQEKCPVTGRVYLRGDPSNDLEPYTLRDAKMWQYVNQYKPKGRAIVGMELGAGRGTLCRHLAKMPNPKT